MIIKWEDNESELEKEEQKMKNKGREGWRREERWKLTLKYK